MALMIENKDKNGNIILEKFDFKGSYVFDEELSKIPQTRKTYACIDIETTGLDSINDEITEISIILFDADDKNNIISCAEVYHSLNQPVQKITKKISEMTGITNEMVKGHFIDWVEVENVLKDVKFIFAHNARFERRFITKYINDRFYWMCTLNDIDWHKFNINIRALDYLTMINGFVFNHHMASADAAATVKLLSIKYKGRSYLDYLNESITNKIKNGIYVANCNNSNDSAIVKKYGFNWDYDEKCWVAFSINDDAIKELKRNNIGLKNYSLSLEELNK